MSSTEPVSQTACAQKGTYRGTNWPEYDRALVARGDITFTPAWGYLSPTMFLQNWIERQDQQ